MIILFLSFWFYTDHHDILFDKKLTITVKAINHDTNENIQYANIIINRIEKPWYSMWQNHKILSATTNEFGELSFEISESKRYGIDVSINKKREFLNDNREIRGGIELEGDKLTNGEIIPIYCKER